MKYFLLLVFLILAGFLHCSEWTVLVYMAADNNLEYSALQNINEMESVSQPASLNLLVQTDLPESGAKRYRIAQDQNINQISSPVLKTMDSIDSGDPQVMKDFLLWGRSRYPAEHYMLVIWGHGNSWFKNSKWISPDYDTGSMIGVANGELGFALAGTGKWDILLFDACSMQSLEIISQIKDYADYVLGSADLVPASGFPYSLIIPYLDQSPALLAGTIPGLYQQSYLPGGIHNPTEAYFTTTCSAISTANWDAFLDAWHAFVRELDPHSEILAEVRAKLFEMNDGNADVDTRQMLIQLADAGIPGAEELLNRWMTHVLAASFTLPYPQNDIGTAAVWFPDIRYNYDAAWELYMQLDFAKTGWLGLVNQFLGEPFTEITALELIRNNIVIDRLILDFEAPLYPDSLHYLITVNGEEQYFFPAAYSTSLTFSTKISTSGSFSIVAMDSWGNSSDPLFGSFSYDQATSPPLVILPNPLRQSSAGKIIWNMSESQAENIHISIYNVKGQRVLHQILSSSVYPGELPLMALDGIVNLRRGIYILKLRHGHDRLRSKFTIL